MSKYGSLVAMALLTACGSSNGVCQAPAVYDCAKPMVAELQPCAHPFTTVGKLDDAGTRCTFDDGAAVTFERNVLTASPTAEGTFHFDVSLNGSTCLSVSYENQGTSASAKTQVRSVAVTTSNGHLYKRTSSQGVSATSATNQVLNLCPGGVSFDEVVESSCHGVFSVLDQSLQVEGSTVRFSAGLSYAGSRTEVFKCAR